MSTSQLQQIPQDASSSGKSSRIMPLHDGIKLTSQLDSMNLNTDVIAEIMEHIQDRRQLCNLMRTCRTFYSIGVLPLLRPPININNLQSLSSFQNFLFAEPLGSNRRFMSVRCLDINMKINELGGAILETILMRSTNLRGISILHGYTFFAWCSDAGRVLESLPLLTDFTLGSAMSYDALCLRQMNAPLSKLKLTIPSVCSEPNIFLILSQQFGNTLIDLEITGAPLSGTSAQFPRLQTLKICTLDAIPAAVLAQTFPNLKSLDIATSYPGSSHRRKVANHQHSLNKAHLSSSGLSLPSLQYLKGNPTNLFYTAMTPQAEEFEVAKIDQANTERLLVILKCVRPSLLRLHIEDDNYFSISTLVTFLQTLFEENPFIESFELIAYFDATQNGDAQDFVDAFPDMVEGASLKSLYLLIRQYGITVGQRSCLRTLDIVNFIAKISIKCPDTQNITVDLRPTDITPGYPRFIRSVDTDKEFQNTGKTFRELREELAQETSTSMLGGPQSPEVLQQLCMLKL